MKEIEVWDMMHGNNTEKNRYANVLMKWVLTGNPIWL